MLNSSLPLEGSYDPALVFISLLAALLASYTAFSLTDRPPHAPLQRFWLMAAAAVLGLGIWAMHFIAMLAFHLPLDVSYDPWITLASVIPAMLASLVVLSFQPQEQRTIHLVLYAILMGGGIGAMHYTGMAAMRLEAQMQHHLPLLLLSLLIGVALSAVSLYSLAWARMPRHHGHKERSLLISAAVMALATAGTHYTAMHAISFAPKPHTVIGATLSHDTLAWLIGGATALIISMLLIAVRLSRRFDLMQRLEHSEAQLRSIIDNTADAIIAIDPQGSIHTFNAAAEQMFGYRQEEVLGQDVSILLPESERDEHQHYTQHASLHAPRIIRRERVLEGRRKDGSLFPIEINIAPLQRNSQMGFVGIARDVTERQQLEKSREQAQRRTDFLLSSSPVAIYTRSAHAPYHLTYISPNAVEIVGFGADCFMQHPQLWIDHVHPDDLPQVKQQLQSLTEGENQLELEYRFQLPDGCYQWINERMAVAHFNAEGPAELVGSWSNIQDKKLVKLALEESEDRLRRSQNYANVGSWDWHIVGGKLLWSERVPALFGYPPGAQEVNFEHYVGLIHPADRIRVIDALTNSMELGKEYNIEHRCIWPDGSEHWLLQRGDSIRDENNRAQRMLGIVQDITQRKLAEQASEQARIAAEQASRAKSEFVSRMSHELRTPLNAIIGFAQLLEYDDDHPLDNEQQSQAKEIGNAGKHLLGLINDVLDLSAIEAGRLNVSLEKVDISQIIQETLALIQPLADQRQLQLIAPKENASIIVHADYTRLKQVLVNLLSNAIKYNRDQGEIRLCVESKSERVRITVSDTGYGLNKKQLEKLFQPFERVGAEKTAVDGAGIGLVISKQLIERMSGKIGVESEEGTGSSFWLELPQITQRTSLVAPEQSSIATKPLTLLYIEDNPANLRLVRELIKKHTPHTLLYSSSPIEGLELAKQHLPDVILLDIHLPEIGGMKVLTQLKQNPDTTHIPVIAISAHASHSDIRDGLEAGFTHYITKPFSLKNLLRALETLSR